MRGFVGIGQSDSIEAAIGEATNGLRNADLLILIAPFNKAAKAAELLSEKYPLVPMIGTTGISVGKGAISDNNITVIGMAGVTVTTGIIKDTTKSPITYIKDFENDLRALEGSADNTVCLEFITNNEEKTISTMNSVLNRYNISLAGGTSYGAPLGEQPAVIYNGVMYKKSCVYAFVKNNAGRINVSKENIYETLSPRPHFATLVDTNTKTLFQLDDTPAFEVYADTTGVEKDDIVENMINNPLGRVLGDDIYLISTNSLDLNGVMFNGKTINDNDSIYIMQLGDYKAINQETRSNIKGFSGRTSFLLSFDSTNRIKLFTKEDYLDEYISDMSSVATYAGHVGDGQQYNTQHMNQTLVLVAFE